MQWQPITECSRDDGSEIVVRLKPHGPNMPPELLGRSVHQIGTWAEGDLWVRGVMIGDDLVEGVMPLPQPTST